MIIEICANSFASAKAAQDAGAHRVELCTQLSVGGLTPSYGCIEKAVKELDIAVHVLVRPRAGNFNYTHQELDIIKRDIAFCDSIGCAGVVSGALNSYNQIDVQVTKELVEASRNIEFTFHRAFDMAQDPYIALQDLETLGVTRILSSGQQPKAIDGIQLLKKLKNKTQTLQIMPGSGINKTNILSFKEAGFEMVHFSALKNLPTETTNPRVSFSNGREGNSDKQTIAEIIALLAQHS
ncbi:copper homeostasis protein CutC [Flavobacteriaceae bacterium]|nr:copper homeostasis protein CutC [Flavobacteriaceae bacterium]